MRFNKAHKGNKSDDLTSMGQVSFLLMFFSPLLSELGCFYFFTGETEQKQEWHHIFQTTKAFCFLFGKASIPPPYSTGLIFKKLAAKAI